MVNTPDNYLEKMSVNENDVFSHEDAVKLANEHVMSYYKGRINLTEVRNYTGKEIAERLSSIQEHFDTKFMKLWNEEFGDEEDI